jgi:hypothetical protein
MDFGFICASTVNYHRPNMTSNRIVYSYDGYSSYLLIVDDKSSMSWILLTKSKIPPVEIVRLFLRTFGRDRTLGRFIRCNQGGELEQSQAFIDMALTEFGYKVKPTAHPRTDRLKNETTSLPSQPAPSSTVRPWNQNFGQLRCSMQPTSTIVVSTPVPVSPLSKVGGVSNQTSSTSNSLVRMSA